MVAPVRRQDHGVAARDARLAGVLAIAIFGATAALVFSWSAPPGARFGIVPAGGDVSRAAVESAFLSAYSAAMVFAAVWCFVAAAISWVALKGTGPAKPKPASAS